MKEGFSFLSPLNSFLNTPNTNHSQGVCKSISRGFKEMIKKTLSETILEFCLLSGKEGGKG